MLKAWGVDTLVVMGAWTEDCIISTAYEAIDRYGIDVVLIEDALATGTDAHTKAVETMGAAAGKLVRALMACLPVPLRSLPCLFYLLSSWPARPCPVAIPDETPLVS